MSTIQYNDVVQAHEKINAHIRRTEIHTSKTLNKLLDAEVYFKCENFQKTGAFKLRGALNALLNFNVLQRQKGVLAFSSGNHAQGIAYAAKILNIPAKILMPKDAPKSKVQATQGYGAEVIFYDRYTENREEIGKRLALEHEMTLIPSYNHPDIIAGQGTAAKELIEDVGQLDAIFVGLGGGGMLSGTLLTAHALLPDCKVYGVEPEAGNDGERSLQAGHIIQIDTPQTIADGAQVTSLGHFTFPIIQKYVADIQTVSDLELQQAMTFFAQRMKMIVEPTGCLGLAGLMKYRSLCKGKRVGVIITGGNIDLERYARLISKGEFI